MDPGARAALIIGLLGAVAVLAAAAFIGPVAPVLVAVTGALAGWAYVRFTRLELPRRPGQGGVVVAPVVVLAQGLGTGLNLLLLGGGVQLGARLTHLGSRSDPMQTSLALAIALILFAMLLALALVLLGAEWAARRAVASREDTLHTDDAS